MIISNSKFGTNMAEVDKLTYTIIDDKNNIADNLASFEEHISRGQISYSFIIDQRYPNVDMRNCEFSNGVSVKIYKQK